MLFRPMQALTDDRRDNEKPVREVHVGGFQAQGRPITNEEVGSARPRVA